MPKAVLKSISNSVHRFLSGLNKTDHRVYVLMILAGLSAALFGADTGSIGAITDMHHFQSTITPKGLTPILRGIIVSIMLMFSAISGTLAGYVADKISRKYTIAIGCLVFSVGSMLCAASSSLALLLAARAIAGLGEGLFLGGSATYLAEVSPSRMRGQMMVLYQVAISCGIAGAFFLCYGTVKIDSGLSWRIPFSTQAILAFILACIFPFLPYSPRFLVLQGRSEEAKQVIELLVGTAEEDERERAEMIQQSPGPSAGFMTLFRKEFRGRTGIALYLQASMQLSGIDFVLYYAPLLFTQAGLDASTASLVASGVTGICFLLGGVSAMAYIDRFGRRAVHIYGGSGLAICLFAIGSIYASQSHLNSAGKWAIVALIELYAICFSTSWAYNTRLYTAEIQPAATRATAVAVSIAFNQAINTIVALTAPDFLARSAYGPYFTYGAFSMAAAIFGYCFMPETQGKTLETIDKDFQTGSTLVPTMPKFLRRLPADADMELRQRTAARVQDSL